MDSQREAAYSMPMGSTRRQYSSVPRLCDLLMPNTRMHRKPTAEQKPMCHMVSVMGKGKPAYASSLGARG